MSTEESPFSLEEAFADLQHLYASHAPLDPPEMAAFRPTQSRPAKPAQRAEVRHISDFADAIIGQLELREEYGNDAVPGERTGFEEVDEYLVVEGGRLVTLGAREGVGKTAWALGVARTIATRQSGVDGSTGKVLYFITEMGLLEVAQRIVAQFAQVESSTMKRDVTKATVESIQRAFALLESSGLYLCPVSGQSVDVIDATARQFAAENPDLRAVFVDNLTGIKAPAGVRNSMRSDELITAVMERLAQLAQSGTGLGVPVWLLAHLKRPDSRNAQARPDALQIAGSDGVNRWSDVLLLLHRKDDSVEHPIATPPASGFSDGGGFGGGGFGGGGFGGGTFNPGGFGTTLPTSFSDGDGKQWKTSEVGLPSPDCSHELLCVKNRDGRRFVADLDFIGPELRFLDPSNRTVRPYAMPQAESARTAEYRAKLRAITSDI
ncbi:AAA family ATPase [Phycicoccus sp. MAQZ13P-2]|uniref:DnaB-like helicase C-terminal domain-containing protein n=1 Tax=Phycicoccus mangrovi TaxID=2840470 RepID=UPI001C003862|nr:DnaB-like helicase C-terminal domain-containing protein [Phycicoccus mangrovi]MBT9254439.1 AAA family ATPase [Phycicoccus mangrovi]MBT9272817.1 AAA family ATPase [Phycicoccus mangrovi]